MSELIVEPRWITDRLPVRTDADNDGDVQILWPNSGHWLYVPFCDVVSGMPWRTPVKTWQVRLTYFKRSGKFYTEGSLEVLEGADLTAIWELVREIRKKGRLPGLSQGELIGGPEFIVLVNVPGHPHEHPHIIV